MSNQDFKRKTDLTTTNNVYVKIPLHKAQVDLLTADLSPDLVTPSHNHSGFLSVPPVRESIKESRTSFLFSLFYEKESFIGKIQSFQPTCPDSCHRFSSCKN